MMKADLVVVGGGPAGSTVANIAASGGLTVIVLEKEEDVGRSPCAGYVSCIDFPDINRKVIQSKINKIRTHFPSGKYVDFPINGFNVNRAQFDKELSLRAKLCGAKFYMNSDVVGLIGGGGGDGQDKNGGGYQGVRLRDGSEIKAKVIVGADGASSVISRLLNFRNEAVTSVQYEVSGCKVDSEINEVYFDIRYAPGCYVWVFPTGSDSARVGLAIRSHLAEQSAIEYLDNFIANHPTASGKFRGSSKTKLRGGGLYLSGAFIKGFTKTTFSLSGIRPAWQTR